MKRAIAIVTGKVQKVRYRSKVREIADTLGIQKFDSLDTKYGRIAENIERILDELKEERKEYRETVERLVKAIIESRKERRER